MINDQTPSQMPINNQAPGTPGANNAAMQINPQTSQNVASFGQSVSPQMMQYFNQMAGTQQGGANGQFSPNGIASQLQALLSQPQNGQAPPAAPPSAPPAQSLPGSSPVVPNSPFAPITPGPFSSPVSGAGGSSTTGSGPLSVPVPGSGGSVGSSTALGSPASSTGGFQLNLPANLTGNFSSPALPASTFVSPAQQAAQAAASTSSNAPATQFTGTGIKQQDLNPNSFGLYGVQNGLYYPLSGVGTGGWSAGAAGQIANPSSSPYDSTAGISQFGPTSTYYNGSKIYSGPVYGTGNGSIQTLVG